MEIYDSIDNLPVAIFDKINRTGELSLLVVDKTARIKTERLEKTWEKIYDEFIVEFGISNVFLSYLNNMKLAINHYINAYINGNRAEINLARARIRDAEEIYAEEATSDGNIYAKVSKFMGFGINPITTSTREFYNYLKLATKNG